VKERSTAEGVTDKLDRGEVNFVMESSPVDGNVIHARELSAVTINHERFKGVPGRVYFKPSDVQLFHAESEAPLDTVSKRESIIRKGRWYEKGKPTHEEAASGM